MSTHHDTGHDTGHHTGHEHGELEAHDLGLSHDLPRIVERVSRGDGGRLGRRGLLGLLGGVGVVGLAGCASGSTTTAATTAADSTTSSTSTGTGPGGQPPAGGAPGGGAESDVEVAEGEIPEETAGPYPGDGSNGPNVLTESGVVRSDLTSSFGGATGVAEGVPTTVRLTVYDLAGTEVTPLEGAAVYLWHCDREGRYSMYDDEVADENYLRGVQVAAADGSLEFTTIFPAAYSGRWPHMHFEVYASLADATTYTNKLRTSQLALPQEACDAVYATEGYEASVANMQQTSLSSDMVFGDGASLQTATATGSATQGYVVTLNVPV